MAEPEDVSYRQLLDRISIQFPAPLDLSDAGPDALAELARRLTQAAYRFNLLAVTEIGGRMAGAGTRTGRAGHVRSVPAVRRHRSASPSIRESPFEKAAMLLRGITQGHPFTDGNKRTGFLTALYFLTEI